MLQIKFKQMSGDCMLATMNIRYRYRYCYRYRYAVLSLSVICLMLSSRSELDVTGKLIKVTMF